MTLVLETGQGLPDANSYISNQDAINHLPSSNLDVWNGLSDDERIDRLVIASQFIDSSFEWVGMRKTFEQGLSWPRVNVMYQGHIVPDNIVPQQIKRASIMALLLIHEFGIEFFRSTGEASIKREKLAVLETEYFEPGMYAIYESRFGDINNMLRGFYTAQITSGVLTADVIRA